MDEDYIYDEYCPEEAEFIHYEGGDSYADDIDYDADYDDALIYQDHCSQTHKDEENNSGFMSNAAMLGAAYMAGRYSASRGARYRDSDWDRSMAKYRQKWQNENKGTRQTTNLYGQNTNSSNTSISLGAAFVIGIIGLFLIRYILIWPVVVILSLFEPLFRSNIGWNDDFIFMDHGDVWGWIVGGCWLLLCIIGGLSEKK